MPMKFARVARTWCPALVVAGITSSLALADEPAWYVGGNAGQARATIDDDRIVDSLLDAGFSTTSISDDDRDFGYKLFGGYQFNRHFALEGGYFDLGEFGFTAVTEPPGTLVGTTKLSGLNLDGVGFLAFTEKLSGLGRIGVNYAEARDSFTGTGSVNVLDPDPSERDTNYKFGLGLQYDFTTRVGMRLEAERYRIDDAIDNTGDIDLFSVGLLVRFGASEPTPVRRAASPPPAAEAPVRVVVPVPVRTQRYCSILDIQFEIGQDGIQPAEKEKLDVVATFMEKYPDTVALIEGHTDDVGTAESNMTLSKRRAQSVVDYLVDNYPIDASRLTAEGYGETRPLADNSTSGGKRMNRRIGAVIACATDIEGLRPVPARITMAMLIEFDPNSAEVGPQYHHELRKVADFLKANAAVTAIVEGHASNQQDMPGDGMQLSRQRADSVVDYLVKDFGIARSRLSAEGFGQTRRFAYNTSADGQQDNRRVNIIFDYPR